MAYCGPLGIPYAAFLGWDDLSRDAALAWQRREGSRCGGCSQYREDLVNADGTEKRPSAVVAVDWYCPACAAAQRHDQQHGDDKPRPGVSTALMPRSTFAQWRASQEAGADAGTVTG